MKKLFAILTLALVGFSAHAQDARPLWTCALEFQGESKGIQLIVGQFHTQAYGNLNCTDGLGGTYSQAVSITMGTHLLGPAIGIGDFKLAGAAGEISLLDLTPDVLLGNYTVAQAQAGFIGGVGAFTAVKVGVPQIALQVSLQLLSGFGVQVGFHEMTIEALN